MNLINGFIIRDYSYEKFLAERVAMEDEKRAIGQAFN